MVVVEQHDALAGRPRPGHDVVRSEDRCAGIDLDGMCVPAADAVVTPRRPGRDHDVVEAVLEDVVGAHRRFAIDLDVVESVELLEPVVDDANPCGEPGKLRLAGHTATEHPARLGERHGIPAITQCACGFEARRSRTDDEHRGVGALHRDALRMPAASEFLTHCGVLRTPDRRHGEVAGHADVATDALADVCEVAAFDLVGHEGIRDRRSSGADEVQDARLHVAHHGVGRGEAAHSDDGLGGELLESGDVRFLLGLGAEARGDRVVLPASEHEVPEVGMLADQAEDVFHLAAGDAVVAEQFVDRDAARDSGFAVGDLAGVLEDLADEADTVLEAAAVLVGAVVVSARQEVVQTADRVSRVDVDDVVAGFQ